MVIIGIVTWLIFKTNSWWANLLWFILVLILSICWCLYPVYTVWKKMFWPITISMLVGAIVVGGCTLLCLPPSVFMTVYSVLMACLTASLMQTTINYLSTLPKEEADKQNMPATDTQKETSLSSFRKALQKSMLPQVRSMVQPLVMVVPMLYCCMLLGGLSAYSSLAFVLLMTAATFVANIFVCVVALMILRPKA